MAGPDTGTSFYPHTISVIRYEIREAFRDASPERELREDNVPAHILWMLDEMEKMDTASVIDAVKAARWLGWILHAVEFDLGWWDNEHSRELVRVDKQNGHDVPHGGV